MNKKLIVSCLIAVVFILGMYTGKALAQEKKLWPLNGNTYMEHLGSGYRLRTTSTFVYERVLSEFKFSGAQFDIDEQSEPHKPRYVYTIYFNQSVAYRVEAFVKSLTEKPIHAAH